MLDILSTYLNEDKTYYRYLLVDPLKPVKDIEPLALDNIKSVFPDSDVRPVLRSDLYYDPNYCPHLILLAEPGEEVEQELLALTLARSEREHNLYKHYICSWISSELDIETLAIKLVEFGVQLGSELKPNEHYFLPFFEHVRLALLQEGLMAESGHGLIFDFAHRYIYMNNYGELTQVFSTKVDIPVPIQSLFRQKVLPYQDEAKLAHSLAKLWLDNREVSVKNPLWLSAKEIMNAKKLGLSNHDDILVYSFYALASGQDLMRYDEVANAVNQAILDETRLSYSFRHFPQQVWDKITPSAN